MSNRKPVQKPAQKQKGITIQLQLTKSATMFKLEYINSELERALGTAKQLNEEISKL